MDGNGKKEPTSKDLLRLVRFGADKIITSTDSDNSISDESIEMILARSREKTLDVEKRLGNMTESSLRSFALDEPAVPLTLAQSSGMSIQQFEGKDYR